MPDPPSELQRLGQEFDADVVEAVAKEIRDAVTLVVWEDPEEGAWGELGGFEEAARAAIEAARPMIEKETWRPIESAPKDGTEFLSYGGPDNVTGKVQPTRWLSPGPYTTENGKNATGERRYQWPDGFYWAGYDGFVGPVSPTHWRPLPAPPAIRALGDRVG